MKACCSLMLFLKRCSSFLDELFHNFISISQRQTVKIQIRRLQKEVSDYGLHCLFKVQEVNVLIKQILVHFPNFLSETIDLLVLLVLWFHNILSFEW